MKKAIIIYKNLSASSGYQPDAQRFTPPHWLSKGAVSLIVAVLSSSLFCSCGKDELPSSLSTDTRVSNVRLETLIPHTHWQLTKLLYTVGDVDFNAAWAKMEVIFTSDSTFFYRNDNIYDPVSHTTNAEKTLVESHKYTIDGEKICIGDEVFQVISADSTQLNLSSGTVKMQLKWRVHNSDISDGS